MHIRHIVTTLFISMFLTTTAGAALIPGFYPGWLKYQKKAAGRNQQVNVPLKSSATSSGNTYTDPLTGMEFVRVPGGCFDMGSKSGWFTGEKGRYDDEGPVHKVCVDGFYMGKSEVTQKQWLAIMGNNPSRFKGDNRPVERVSWNDVQGYIKKLNRKSGRHYRLPTEAEWEYAARGGTTTRYYWGDSIGHNHAVCDGCSSKWDNVSPAPVGDFAANPFGLYDMSGNVWEWCSDWYGKDYYSNSPRNNPLGPSSGSSRVIRGGSWYGYTWNVRSANRNSKSLGHRSNGLGFRLVLLSSVQ